MVKKPGKANTGKLPFRLKAIALISLFIAIYWFIPPVWKLAEPDMTVRLSNEREGGSFHVAGPQRDGWIEMDQVTQDLIEAIVASEDARFYQHRGLDIKEIINSIHTNINEGRKARGASTITQQLVKMAFLTREKSYLRKAREAVGALILEQLLEKNHILEWYVNLAEFGPDIYGVNEAARYYFQSRPGTVTLQQAIHLALVLPNPRLWSTGLRQKELTDFGHLRFSQIAENLRQAEWITEEEWIAALSTGNFGRPIKDRDKLIAQYFAEIEAD